MIEYFSEPDLLALRVYITGDTLLIDDLREIPRRYDSIDVAVLHLGGPTLPGGLVVTTDGAAGARRQVALRVRRQGRDPVTGKTR